MLVLTRGRNQSIVFIVDGKVLARVTVNNVRTGGGTGGCVQLGCEAPLDVKIHREEIWEEKLAEEKAP